MKFRKYHSIENSYRQKFIEKIRYEGYDKEDWVVTEKIHGANFSFTVIDNNNELEFKAAKRTAYITEDDNFFGNHWIEILERMKPNLARLFIACFKEYQCGSITVYGELFGGKYIHSEVDKTDMPAIQKHVEYCPDHQFIAFDLMVDNKYMDWNDAKLNFDKFGIACLEELFRGSFDACLEFSNEFQTTIPKYFGLPEIEGNMCEGTVLKPANSAPFLYDKSRAIIKNKNDKFKEKHGSFNNKPKQPKPLPENIQELIDVARKYATEQRLDNVISKHGEAKQSDFGLLMKMMNEDAYEDFYKDNEENILTLDKKDVTLIRKKLGAFNASIIKHYMRENV